MSEFLNRNRAIVSIVAAAILLRLVWAFWASLEPISDFAAYHRMAQNVIDGRGWLGRGLSAISPGYPAFLVAIFTISRSLAAAWVANAALGGLSVYLTFVLSRRLTTSVRLARISACIVAFYPDLVIYSGSLASENLAIPLFLAAVLLVILGGETKSSIVWGLSGFTIGLLALTRGMILIWVPFVVAWAWLDVYKRDFRKALLPTALIVACALLAISPWTARNWRVHGKLVPITTELGLGLLGGNNVIADGEWMMDYINTYPTPDGLDEVDKSRFMTAAAIDYIVGNPGGFIILAAKKFGLFWGIKMDAAYKNQTRLGPLVSLAMSTIGQSLMVALFVAGLFATFPWSSNVRITLTATLGLILLTVTFYYLTRYRVVLYPLWAPIVAAGICEIPKWLRSEVPRPKYLLITVGILFLDWLWVIRRSYDKIVAYSG